MKRLTKKQVVERYTRNTDPGQLRYKARLAYLDGCGVYAKELNRRADILAAHLRSVSA